MAGIKRTAKHGRATHVAMSMSTSASKLLASQRSNVRRKSIAASALAQAKALADTGQTTGRPTRAYPVQAKTPVQAASVAERTAPTDVVRQSVDDFLEIAQAVGADAELVSVMLTESADLLRTPTPRSRALTEEQAAFLVASGTMTIEQLRDSEDRIARGELAEMERKTRLESVTRSLSSAQVAQRLGIDESSVRHRVRAGSLYSFLIGRKRRFPAWQFSDTAENGLLTDLPALVRGIPLDMHPSTVEGFMTTTQDDLVVGEAAVTPVEWLELAHEVDAVIGILESYLQS